MFLLLLNGFQSNILSFFPVYLATEGERKNTPQLWLGAIPLVTDTYYHNCKGYSEYKILR